MQNVDRLIWQLLDHNEGTPRPNFAGAPSRSSAPDGTTALGTVSGDYTTGRPIIQHDGEDQPSVNPYPHVDSYTPAANDRVMMVQHQGQWVVMGKVI